jgi:hypothetical protein
MSFLKELKTILIITLIGYIVSKLIMAAGFKILGAISYIVVVVILMLYSSISNIRKNYHLPAHYLRNLITIILIVFFYFSLVFYMIPINGNNYIEVNGNATNLTFAEAAYFSAVTLTTLGYGDMAPHGFFRAFSAVEAILGLVFLGLFVSGINLLLKKQGGNFVVKNKIITPIEVKKGFFEKNKSIIQGISSIIQAVTVIILVIVTIFYAVSTKNMANVMIDEFELSKKPYLKINDINLEENSNNSILNILLANVGNVPILIDRLETNIFGSDLPSRESLVITELGPGQIGNYKSTLLFYKMGKGQLIRIKAFYTNALYNEQEYCHESIAAYKYGKLILISSKSCDLILQD